MITDTHNLALIISNIWLIKTQNILQFIHLDFGFGGFLRRFFFWEPASFPLTSVPRNLFTVSRRVLHLGFFVLFSFEATLSPRAGGVLGGASLSTALPTTRFVASWIFKSRTTESFGMNLGQQTLDLYLLAMSRNIYRCLLRNSIFSISATFSSASVVLICLIAFGRIF